MQFTSCIKCSFTVNNCNKASNRIVPETGFSVFFRIILSHKVSRHFPTCTHTSTYANFENLLYICCTLVDIPLQVLHHYHLNLGMLNSKMFNLKHALYKFLSFQIFLFIQWLILQCFIQTMVNAKHFWLNPIKTCLYSKNNTNVHSIHINFERFCIFFTQYTLR